MSLAEFGDPLCINVETDYRVALAESSGQRQADVAQAEDGDTDVVLGGEHGLHRGEFQ